MSFEEEGQAVVREIGRHQDGSEEESAEPQLSREPEESPRPKRSKKVLIIAMIATSLLGLSVLLIGIFGGGGEPEEIEGQGRITFAQWVGEEARREEAREAIRKQTTRWRIKGREPAKAGLSKFLDNLVTNIRGFFN